LPSAGQSIDDARSRRGGLGFDEHLVRSP
jgi:hypothetical protein